MKRKQKSLSLILFLTPYGNTVKGNALQTEKGGHGGESGELGWVKK